MDEVLKYGKKIDGITFIFVFGYGAVGACIRRYSTSRYHHG